MSILQATQIQCISEHKQLLWCSAEGTTIWRKTFLWKLLTSNTVQFKQSKEHYAVCMA